MMNDFLNIKWQYKSYENNKEDKSTFVDDLSTSYAYKPILENDYVPNELINLAPIKEYVPGSLYTPTDLPNSSCLSQVEHNKCLKALELYQSGRTNLLLSEQNLINLYLNFKQKILNENAKYLDFVKHKWTKDKNVKVKPALIKYGLDCWRRKLQLINNYAQHYQQFDTIPFSLEGNENDVEMKYMHNLLEVGTVAKFLQPALIMKTTLTVSSLPETNEQLAYSQLPVSADENVQDLLQKWPDVDVVMSSGSLTKFVNYLDDQAWDMPVIIRKQSNPGDGTIIYIDKPLAKKVINLNHVNEYVHKVLFKSNFCASEEFSHPTVNKIVNSDKQQEDEPLSKCSLSEEANIEVNKALKFKGKTFHNASYSLWKLFMKLEENDAHRFKHRDKQFNVLLRCKTDACEQAGDGSFIPVCTYSKLEHQLKYGVNIPTKAELAKQWVYLSSRPFSKLYRARIHNTTSEVVAIDACTAQKINEEALYHHKFKPYHGIILLYKFVNEMKKFEPGNYIIRFSPKTGPFLLLLRECNLNFVDAYNLHRDYEENQSFSKEVNSSWCPIDVNYILPIHRQRQILPGLFNPRAPNRNVDIKKKGKRKKKKNTKM